MKTILFSFICCLISVCLNAQPGTLDNNFGDSGKVINKYFGSCRFMVLQKDNKILCGGSLSGTGYRLVRYLNNGIIDSSFGKEGIADIATVDPYAEMDGIKLQQDQKIVIGGWGRKNGIPTFIIARCLQDGSLDESFGTNGIVDTTFGIGESIVALGLQPDGKILATGWYYPSSYITARYNTDGTIDESFGNNGIVFTDFGVFVLPSSTIVQPDNKIVVAGSTSSPANFLLVRYMPDGSLDNSFGNNGKTVTDFGKGDDVLRAMALQADGKIVVTGVSNYDMLDNMALARYDSNGFLDTSFGQGGKVTCKFKGLYSQANAILIQPDNKLIISGISYSDAENIDYFTSARYLPNGIPDSSYGINSQVLTTIDTVQLCYASALQKDGKIILAGTTINYDYSDNYALVRYNNDLTQKQIIINKIKHYISTHNNATAITLTNNISLYPNPVNNILSIKGLNATLNYNLLIMNDKASVVASKQITNLSPYQFNVQNLSSGVYYLNVVANNNIITTLKFVKE